MCRVCDTAALKLQLPACRCVRVCGGCSNIVFLQLWPCMQVLFPYATFLKFMAATDVCRGPPLGLQNCGNTCFANALLQCLLHTQPFIAYLRCAPSCYVVHAALPHMTSHL